MLRPGALLVMYSIGNLQMHDGETDKIISQVGYLIFRRLIKLISLSMILFRGRGAERMSGVLNSFGERGAEHFWRKLQPSALSDIL